MSLQEEPLVVSGCDLRAGVSTDTCSRKSWSRSPTWCLVDHDARMLALIIASGRYWFRGEYGSHCHGEFPTHPRTLTALQHSQRYWLRNNVLQLWHMCMDTLVCSAVLKRSTWSDPWKHDLPQQAITLVMRSFCLNFQPSLLEDNICIFDLRYVHCTKVVQGQILTTVHVCQLSFYILCRLPICPCLPFAYLFWSF